METKFTAAEMIEIVVKEFKAHLRNHFADHSSLWCYHHANSCSTMLARFGVSKAEIEAITEEIRNEIYGK